MTLLSWLVLAGIAAAALSIVLYTWLLGVPPMPSRRAEAQAAIELLRELRPGARIYELGAGWGGLAVQIARARPDAQVVGFERSPLPFWVASVRAARRANCRIHRRDFFAEDLSPADAVVAFLMMEPMTRLAPKLDRELRPGVPAVVIAFQLRGRRPEATRCGGDVALYRAPAES